MRAIALLLGIVLTTTALHAQGTAAVSGIVTDENGAPVREVLVVIDPDSLSLRTRTSADGRYRITVPTGRYEVRVVRIGFKPQSLTINVTESTHELNITMTSVPIPLTTVSVRVSRPGLYGTVLTRGIELLPHAPTPLRAANIQVLNEPYQVRTERDGRFSIPDLPIGAHSILVALDHYITRMIPVTVPPEGGVELTIQLDSLYADYQRREEVKTREIGWRIRRATNPATFVSAHDLDPEAKDLRQALRFAQSVLTRGINVMDARIQWVIYIDGQRTYLQPADLKAEDIASFSGIEVYPTNTLDDALSVPGSMANIGALDDGMLFGRGQRAPGFSNRTSVRTRGNSAYLLMIWTSKRR
jgi:carboxypeptidase family protein